MQSEARSSTRSHGERGNPQGYRGVDGCFACREAAASQRVGAALSFVCSSGSSGRPPAQPIPTPASPTTSAPRHRISTTSPTLQIPRTSLSSQEPKAFDITANMEFGTSGNLSEGACLLERPDMIYSLDTDVSLPADGIHIDMNRLKAGEVK